MTLQPQGWLRAGLRLCRIAEDSPPGCPRLALPARHPWFRILQALPNANGRL